MLSTGFMSMWQPFLATPASDNSSQKPLVIVFCLLFPFCLFYSFWLPSLVLWKPHSGQSTSCPGNMLTQNPGHGDMGLLWGLLSNCLCYSTHYWVSHLQKLFLSLIVPGILTRTLNTNAHSFRLALQNELHKERYLVFNIKGNPWNIRFQISNEMALVQ